MAKTTSFDPSHSDRVTTVHVNFNGTKILTASIDHRIKVWSREPRTGERTLLDTFTAHDADIRDVSHLRAFAFCSQERPRANGSATWYDA